jgi:hypothetical protein
VAGHEHAGGIAAVLLGVVDRPRDRRPHLAHDRVEPGGRRQRVLDQREVEAGRQERLAEEGVGLLVVRLPVAAVDVDEGRGGGTAAREDVEPLPLAPAVAPVERSLKASLRAIQPATYWSRLAWPTAAVLL